MNRGGETQVRPEGRASASRASGAATSRATGHEGSGLEVTVLCGGRSRRMGSDKALLAEPTGGTRLDAALDVARSVGGGVALSVGARPRYADRVRPGERLVLDLDGDGPLAGLAAALGASRARWTLTLPIDMPGVDAQLLRALADEAERRDADLCLARGPRGPEPLVGAFGPRCAEVASALLAQGERRPIALADAAHGLRAVELELDGASGADVLRNVNHPEEWHAELERRAAG